MEKHENLLNHQVTKNNLILSSLYLSAYELLKYSVIERIKGFFTFDFEEDKTVIDDQYKDEVLKLHKDPFIASCLWLEKNGAITEAEIEQIKETRSHRNEIAHELPKVLVEGFEVHIDCFLDIRRLLEKIDKWWIQNVDIPSNSDNDGIIIRDDDIYSGATIIIDHLVSIYSKAPK